MYAEFCCLCRSNSVNPQTTTATQQQQRSPLISVRINAATMVPAASAILLFFDLSKVKTGV